MRNHTIAVEDILTYVQIGGELKKLETVKTELRKDLIEQLKAGYRIPTTSPYTLQLTSQERAQVDWRTETITLLKRVFGTNWRREFRRLQKQYMTTVEYLYPKPNPAFKAERKKVA